MLSGRVVLFEFEENKIKDILKNENVDKLIIFDSEEARYSYEQLYHLYKDRITLYESDDIVSSFDSYCQARQEEGIEPFDHIVNIEILQQSINKQRQEI
jgi:hypothetical protein